MGSARQRVMLDFKGGHFEGEIVLWAGRWYRRYWVSYRDLEQMIGERGVSVDHSTIYRQAHRHAPKIAKRLRWQWRGLRSASWRVDETYVKVRLIRCIGSLSTGTTSSRLTRAS
jgi:transposase-like protein